VVQADGTLADLRPFAERGGESVTVDSPGNVYAANRQVIVYDPAGRQTGEIDVPERPIDLVFGGKNLKTLFILAHHAPFSTRVE
jgi:sugar lactone lactonase YvrE